MSERKFNVTTQKLLQAFREQGLACYNKRLQIDFPVNKTILIIGGTKGLGLNTAIQLMGKGAKVLITSRSQSVAQKVASDLNKQGSREQVEGFAIDVTDFNSIDKGLTIIKNKFGEIDVALLNAGVGSFDPLSREEFENCQKVNVHGTIHAALKAKDLVKQGGRIVVVSASFANHQAIPKLYVNKINQASSINDPIFKEVPYDTCEVEVIFWSYALSKAIINRYVELAAQDPYYQSKGIELATCDPCGTKTELNNFSENVPFDPQQGAEALVWPVATREQINGGFYLYGHPIDVRKKLI